MVNLVVSLFVFLSLYYRLLWQAEIAENDKLQRQKAELIQQIIDLKQLPNGHHVTKLDLTRSHASD